MNKPTKPNITIPESFAANGVKADFDNNKILNGFDRIQPDVLAGDNLNKFIDDTYKASNYALNLGDYVLGHNQITNCILEAPNGVATYSGNTVTIKKGLKGLIPDGLNSDGTYKNIEYIVENDKVVTFDYNSVNNYLTVNIEETLLVDEQLSFFIQDTQPDNTNSNYILWYNPKTNYLYHSQEAGTPFVRFKGFIIGNSLNKNSNGIITHLNVFQPVNLNNADISLSNLSTTGALNCAKYALGKIHYDPNDFSKIGAYWAVQNLTNGSVNIPDGGLWLTFVYKYNANTNAESIGSAFEVGIVPGGTKLEVTGNYPHYYYYGIRISEA